MLLLNGDKIVLRYDLDEMYIEVVDNQFLPYSLKDCITTSDFSSKEKMKKSLRDIDRVKDFLSGRTLNLTRDNAKAILNSLSFNQSLRTDERIKIVTICQALTMTDNFWIKEEASKQCFCDVNLREKKLKDAAYEIAILGKSISVTKDILQPDLGTDGMFMKTWYRGKDSIELWKSDKTNEFTNTRAELMVSHMLDSSNVKHVTYHLIEQDGKMIASCQCIANDNISLINAIDLSDWCEHSGIHFLAFLEDHFLTDFSRMCVIDYVIANTDRHLGNIHFLVENKTNELLGMAPLMDHNQALIADEFGTDVSDLMYDATNLTMLETAKKYWNTADLRIKEEVLSEPCRKRLDQIRCNGIENNK